MGMRHQVLAEKLFLSAFLILLISPVSSWSSKISNPTSRVTLNNQNPQGYSGRTSSYSKNQLLVDSGTTEDLKHTIVNGTDLDFERGTQLTWPPLPRSWLEYSTTTYVSSNTYVGFKANPQLFAFNSTIASKLSFDFRYQVKSSFVAIVSRSNQILSNSGESKIFEYDDKYMKTYLSAKDSPMVGLCVYEVQFAYDRGTSLSFDILGSGQSLNSGTIATITQTHFSSFFSIVTEKDQSNPSITRSKLSIDQYQEACLNNFHEKIAPSVNIDFSKQIMNFVFYNHPKSQCKPKFDHLNPNGDEDCQNWFQENIHPTIRKITLPRCTLQPGGIHACTLKAKSEGVQCPIYLHNDNSYSDKKLDANSRKITTRNIHVPIYPCDESLGLKCQITKEPTFIGNVLLSNAEARCRR